MKKQKKKSKVGGFISFLLTFTLCTALLVPVINYTNQDKPNSDVENIEPDNTPEDTTPPDNIDQPGDNTQVTYKHSVFFWVLGEKYNVQEVNALSDIVMPEAPSIDGYKFLGWHLAGNKEVIITDFTTLPDEKTISLFAKFESNSTSDNDGGSTDEDNGTEEEITYTVTFLLDGVEHNKQTVSDMSELVMPTEPTFKDFIFDGWYLGEIKVEDVRALENGNYVLNAKYSPKTYTVTFMVDNVKYSEQVVENLSFVTMPTAPSKSGYNFIGWYVGEVKIENVSGLTPNNYTLTAKYEEVELNLLEEDIGASTNLYSSPQVYLEGGSNSSLEPVIYNSLTYSPIYPTGGVDYAKLLSLSNSSDGLFGMNFKTRIYNFTTSENNNVEILTNAEEEFSSLVYGIYASTDVYFQQAFRISLRNLNRPGGTVQQTLDICIKGVRYRLCSEEVTALCDSIIENGYVDIELGQQYIKQYGYLFGFKLSSGNSIISYVTDNSGTLKTDTEFFIVDTSTDESYESITGTNLVKLSTIFSPIELSGNRLYSYYDRDLGVETAGTFLDENHFYGISSASNSEWFKDICKSKIKPLEDIPEDTDTPTVPEGPDEPTVPVEDITLNTGEIIF